MKDFDLLEIERGTVVAPAGCGKTHSIALAIKRHDQKKPILVLTHTNSGVAALRGRLDRAGVSRSAYRLTTIDGWAMKLISTFPQRAGHNPKILDLENPKIDYPNIRSAAAKLLKSENVHDVLASSYGRIFVDEYQDCSIRQHAVVYFAAKSLPVCTLGDPLQAIFGFGPDSLANWNEHVCKHFPIAGELSTPWRWINAGAEPLGRWLLQARQGLLEGRSIDLTGAPDHVEWIRLDGAASDHPKLLQAARTRASARDGTVLVIGDSINAESRYRIASSVAGAVTVEAVDLRDLVNFARDFKLNASDALQKVAYFAQSVMANVGAADLVQRATSLARGAARKEASDVERVAVDFLQKPSHAKIIDLLVEIGKEGGVRTYRPTVLRACITALQLCQGTEGMTFHSAAVTVREQNRLHGRVIPRRAIGSTLLLKGLEADVAVVLHADELDRRNLYVAMTRGCQKLVICSKNRLLTPTAT
jgi:DNA helicase-2/ATP-dependent DNA helicase PcrA